MKIKTKKLSDEALISERFASLSRRNFLRGLGACMALPALECVAPVKLLAAATADPKLATTATGVPLRTAFVYFPNGAIPSAWWPKSDENNFEFSPTLQPLAAARNDLQILGGLDNLCAIGGMDGGGDHARANATFLTGVRVKKSAVDIRAGISIDQLIAQEVGHLTRFPSLELTCDAGRNTGACDSGYSCAYQYNLSWSSPTRPMTPETNPRLVFERLFGAGAPGERTQNLKRRRQEQRSILDFVRDDANTLQKRLNAGDRDKLDQYLTAVREIETRIEHAEKLGEAKDPGIETPSGIPASFQEHIQIMFDMMVLAFQTDSTRVSTMLLSHDGSNRSFADIGIPEGHHDLSHHQNDQEKIRKIAQIDLFYATQFAKFLEKLRNTKDTDGQSLLHNSMIVYGGGNADGNRHTHSNLPLILAGNGGGTLNTGRFIHHGAKPTTNLFLSMADRMGIQGVERFGDSTGRISNV